MKFSQNLHAVVLLIVMGIAFGLVGALLTGFAILTIPKFHAFWSRLSLELRLATKLFFDIFFILAVLKLIGIDFLPSALFSAVFVGVTLALGAYKSSSLELDVRTVNIHLVSSAISTFFMLGLQLAEPLLFPTSKLDGMTLEANSIVLALLCPLLLLPARSVLAFFSDFGVTRGSKKNLSRSTPTVLAFLGKPTIKAVTHYKALIEIEGNQITWIADPQCVSKHYLDGSLIVPPDEFLPLLRKSAVGQICLVDDGSAGSLPVTNFLAKAREMGIPITKIDNLSQNRVKKMLSMTELTRTWKELAQQEEVTIELPPNLVKPLNASVAVIGGAGSIGAKIVESLLYSGFSNVHVLDQSELGLYQIGESFETAIGDSVLTTHLVDIKDESTLIDLFLQIRPVIVFHVAAYKHVHISEANPEIVFQTNVVGTNNLLRASLEAGSEFFTFISTDKAVYPTNFMGATKRMAELLVSHWASAIPNMNFNVVRFGNVMGSSGSALIKFAEQITSGNVVTLTHPNVERFFMTIEQAAQLVTHTTLNKYINEGKTNFNAYLLDMGKSRTILSVIEDLVRISGKRLVNEVRDAHDIRVVITGLRPGEKLFEELSHGEFFLPTWHPSIKRLKDGVLNDSPLLAEFENVFVQDKSRLARYLQRFSALINSRQAQATAPSLDITI